MSTPDEKIAVAAESIAASEAAQAEAAADVASAIVAEKTGEAAEVVVAAATAAAALANVTAAEAEQQAAESIAETQGELSWLRQHAASMENSLNEVSQRQTSLETQTLSIAEMLGNISQNLQSLTQPKSEQNPSVNPAELAENEEGQEGQTIVPEEKTAGKILGQPKPRRWI